MSKKVFISYSRKDQEYVRKLAVDLNDHVDGGIWFDQSSIKAGEKWKESINNGIAECHVMVLVLSPNAEKSRNVQAEVDIALKSGKRIIPILYKPIKPKGKIADLVRETQYIDLQLGNYDLNLQKLLDALTATNIIHPSEEKLPFLSDQVKINWKAVVYGIFYWSFAWGISWTIIALTISLFFLMGSKGNNNLISDYLSLALFLSIIGGANGLFGGFLSGLITMVILRKYAQNITWKSVSPTIKYWSLWGITGIILSAIIMLYVVLVDGNFPVEHAFLIIFFLVGNLSGWMSLRSIRQLEPSIELKQIFWVMVGWGAITAGLVFGIFN